MEQIRRLYSFIKERTVGSHELSSVYFKQVNGTLIIKLAGVLISFVYVPIVLGFLDQEKFGIWITLNTIVRWLRLADIGIGGGMRLKLSQALANKDNEKGREHISTTYGIIGGIFLFLLLVFYFVNPSLDWQKILNSSLIPGDELFWLTTVTVTFVVLGFILKTVNFIYLAHGYSIPEGLTHMVSSVLTLLLLLLVSRFGEKGNIILLAAIVTGDQVIIYFFFSIYTFLLKFTHLRPSFSLIRLKESGSLMAMSLQSFVSSITYLVIYGSVPFVVAHLFSPGEVTVFNIAYSLFNLPIMIISLLVAPVKPLITLAYTRNDYGWIRMMQGKLNKISLAVVAGTIVLIIFNQFIYHVWIGDKVDIPFWLSLSIGVFAIVNVLQFSNSIIVLGTGKMMINVILSPINIGLYLGLTFILSRIMHNLISVSIALTVTCLIPLIVYPFWLKKVMPENQSALVP
ncbi:MAG TPA: hypothetical protein PLR88_07775 [Bacteroidales bacterium]|nr:hypothetical protein [Bacteroidales bacterium]